MPNGNSDPTVPAPPTPQPAPGTATGTAPTPRPELLKVAGANPQRFSNLLQKYNGNEFLALMAHHSGTERLDKGQMLPQSVQYAAQVLRRARGETTPSAAQQAPSPSQQPPWYQRMARSVEGGLGATPAYAEEPPKGAAAAPTGAPAGGGGFGFFGGGGAPATPAPQPAPAAPAMSAPAGPTPYPQGPPATGQAPVQLPPGMSLHVGPLELKGPQPMNPTAQEKTQAASIHQSLAIIDHAMDYYKKNIEPNLSEFGQTKAQSLWTDPKATAKGLAEPWRWTHSRYGHALGGGLSESEQNLHYFYDLQGPIMAQQLRSLVGGRLSENLLHGPLAKHLPDPMQQDLPGQYQRLQAMRETLPLILGDVYNLKSQGLDDNAISQSVAQKDAAGGYGTWGTEPPSSGAPGQAAPTATPTAGGKKFWE